MKVALLADIHDNHPRLEKALEIAKKEEITTAICLGDVSTIETLEMIARSFKKVYLVFGNMDYTLQRQTALFPENVEFFSEEGADIKISARKIFIVHYDFLARKAGLAGLYDVVFYGHTHTPWEKTIGRTILLNPGEISGQFGPASFAIYDFVKMKGKLHILD